MIRTILATVLCAASMSASAILACDGDTTNTVFWTVGQDTGAIRAVGFDTGVECWATGLELAYVRANFTGLRGRAKAGDVLWTGDDAQFLVDNL